MRLFRNALFLLILPPLFAGCVSLTQAEKEALLKESGIPTTTLVKPQGERGPLDAHKTDPQIINSLLSVLERSDRIPRPDPGQLEDKPLGEILKVGSPIGYQLRTRYFNPGIPIADALSNGSDPLFRDKLIELARWEGAPEVRAMALVALGRFHKEEDFKVFQEAIANNDPGIRFGAMEALLEWSAGEGAPPALKAQAAPMFKVASTHDKEPILRVYAAQAGVRLGDNSLLGSLRNSLDSVGWLERAFAAHYLGELGEAKDYDTLAARLGREQNQDFVLAEYCIAALKLFPKKEASLK